MLPPGGIALSLAEALSVRPCRASCRVVMALAALWRWWWSAKAELTALVSDYPFWGCPMTRAEEYRPERPIAKNGRKS
jgi:hypothetical protein